MTGSARESLVRRSFDELWSGGDETVADEIGDVVFHHGGVRHEVDAPGLRGLIAGWRRGFPDLVFEVQDLIEADDRIAVRARLRGTHTGEWRGRPPTGRHMDVDAMFFFRFEGDELVEIWEVDDRLRRDEQLGPDGP